MTKSRYPRGWDEEWVQRVLSHYLSHYEDQTGDEAVAEDEAAFEEPDQALMEVPTDLVPAVRELIARWQARASA